MKVCTLYKMNHHGGIIMTEEYIKAFNIEIAGTRDKATNKARKLYSIPYGYGVFKVYDVSGVRTAFLHGEKNFFWTEEERDAYRAEYYARRALGSKKQKVLRALQEKMDGLTIEQVEAILKIIT